MNSTRLRMLEHHLSDATRSARRNLLFVCVVSYLLIRGELVPDKIDLLGLNLGQVQHQTLLQVLFALLVYYVIKFYLYMYIDGELQVHKANEALLGEHSFENWVQFAAALKKKQRDLYGQVGGKALVLVILRAAIDSTLPLFAAIYALYLVYGAL